MTRMRALVLATALAAVALITPAAAQAAPPSSSSVVVGPAELEVERLTPSLRDDRRAPCRPVGGSATT